MNASNLALFLLSCIMVVPSFSQPSIIACCTDGACSETTQVSCIMGGGTPTMSPSCELDTCDGACCLGSAGVCMDLPKSTCEILSGTTYQGDTTTCIEGMCPTITTMVPSPTPTPTGACCGRPSLACEVIEQRLCGTQGGDYQGDGSTCEVCSTPTSSSPPLTTTTSVPPTDTTETVPANPGEEAILISTLVFGILAFLISIGVLVVICWIWQRTRGPSVGVSYRQGL